MLGVFIGNYRLVAELGEGGMGTVYFAEHELIGRRAAVKVLRDDVAADEDIVQRFFNEARAVNEIRHPNIVEVTDFGCADGRHYIVMELLEGETLGARLEREQRLSEPMLRRVTRQIASALGAAHARGVVHRDLKPENVFLCNHPDFPDHVKVLDFGIAKLTHGAPTQRKMTEAGVLMGTPMYMSPEQCVGEVGLGPSSDIYSLGIVMYEMATGRRPFEGPALGQLIVSHVNETPAPPAQHNPALSSGLNEIILRTLAKRPEERFADMLALRTALEALDRKPVSPPRPVLLPPPPPDAPEQQRAARVGTVFEKIIMKRIRENRLKLPAMPGAALRCLELTRARNANVGAVASALAHDPLLAAQVMRLANSATYGAGRTAVVTIDQAVSRLGLGNLTTVVVEYAAHQVFASKNPRIREAFQGLWEHSLAVGLLARDLQRQCGGADGDTVYLAGLLHDVGKPVIGALLLEAERVFGDEEALPWLTESGWREVVASTHRDVGVALAESWKLPPPVAQAISGAGSLDKETARTPRNIVCLANALAKHAGFALPEAEVPDMAPLIAEGAALLGLDLDRLHEITAGLADRLASMTDSQPAAPKQATAPATGSPNTVNIRRTS